MPYPSHDTFTQALADALHGTITDDAASITISGMEPSDLKTVKIHTARLWTIYQHTENFSQIVDQVQKSLTAIQTSCSQDQRHPDALKTRLRPHVIVPPTDPSKHPVHRPLSPELWEALVLDWPDHLEWIRLPLAVQLGGSLEGAWTLADHQRSLRTIDEDGQILSFTDDDGAPHRMPGTLYQGSNAADVAWDAARNHPGTLWIAPASEIAYTWTDALQAPIHDLIDILAVWAQMTQDIFDLHSGHRLSPTPWIVQPERQIAAIIDVMPHLPINLLR